MDAAYNGSSVSPRPDSSQRPLLALTVGDPAGIGPEIVAQCLADPSLLEELRLVAVGPEACRPEGLTPFDPARPVERAAWLASEGPDRWEPGAVQESCGAAALAALRVGHSLAMEGTVDALVTGPVSKAALHLAGETVEGQTELLARWAGVERYAMVGEAGQLRVMLLTRHMPLSEALARIEPAAIVARLELFHQALQDLGFERPRLAVAGLNPHAGEGGLFGSEERDRIEPALAAAREGGLAVDGPVSPDSVFLDASRGRWDGVLALYHDQAFIPLKLLAAGERGLTWIAGLPFPRLSPVHGTAFDLVGTGRASAANLRHVLRTAAQRVRWRASRRTPDPGARGYDAEASAPRRVPGRPARPG